MHGSVEFFWSSAQNARVKCPDFVQTDVPLAPLTTLEVGGPARWFARVRDEAELAAAVAWADHAGHPLLMLGGGSNLLVADAGYPGLVVQLCDTRVDFAADGRVSAAAGADWDRLVGEAVGRGLAGVECLAGIPGRVGAAPIQNIGAYGQEVAEVVESVRALDLGSGNIVDWSPQACGFGYRTSQFKREGGQLVVAVTLRLRPDGAPTMRYAELLRHATAEASLAEVREAVLGLRRGKSMVIDPADENRRSAGSFFLNPVVSAAEADRVAAVAPEDLPRWDQPDGQVKLSAAWLIERSGLPKGSGDGAVGLSTRHTLAVVNRGGARASDIVAFAGAVRKRVEQRFGVSLCPEPVFVGFDRPAGELLKT